MEVIQVSCCSRVTILRESLCIVGIGSSRGAALELIRKIIDEVYREQGNFDIPSYLQIGRESMPESGVTQP